MDRIDGGRKSWYENGRVASVCVVRMGMSRRSRLGNARSSNRGRERVREAARWRTYGGQTAGVTAGCFGGGPACMAQAVGTQARRRGCDHDGEVDGMG